MPVLVGAGMVFQVALAIDRWVHKQGYDGVKLAEELDTVKGAVASLRKAFEGGNAALSKKMGEINTHLVTLELDIVRLKAFDEAAHRHRREDD